MSTIKSIFTPVLSKSLLALALASGAGAAFAGPTYHVSIDTSTLGSGTAYIDLALGALTGAAPVTATLNNFSGNFGSYTETNGASSGSVGGSVVLMNGTSYNDLFQGIVLGGLFSFDVSFDTSGSGSGTTFYSALYGSDMQTYLGLQGNLVQIDLQPGMADVVSPDNAFASVQAQPAADVPEPASWALLAGGAGLLGCMRRRRA